MSLGCSKIEEGYHENITLLEKALNADSVIVTDLEGYIVYWNKFAESMYNWESNEVIGKKIYDTVVPISKKADMDFIINNYVINNGYWEGPVKDKTKAGKILHVFLKMTLLRDKTGDPMGIVLISRDISKMKKIEGHVARLDRLNLIGEMAASIGHEVRNPMTTVRGFLQLLANKQSNVHQREYYNLMIDELDRANSIITEYLSLAKNKTIQLKNQSLNEIISNLLPLLTANAAIVDILIETEFSNIPDLYLDYRAISQLVINIVSNGIEAMSSGGGLTLKTYLEHDNVVLAIRDQGTGIPEEILYRIGEPFVTTKEKGTGLGLAVCYGICAKHHAIIDIKTGKTGTTFFIKFPIEKRSRTESELVASTHNLKNHQTQQNLLK